MSALPLSLHAYRGGLYLLEPALAGLLAWRRSRGKEDPARVSERRGYPGRPRPAGPLVWMHGASVGETLALVQLAEHLTARGLAVLITSGTRNSAAMLERRLPPGALHQYVPLDAPRYLARFLAHWRPHLALMAESEIWPNTVLALEAAGVPLGLVNARLSARSARGWGRTPRTARALFSRVALCVAQSDEDAARFAALGCPAVRVAGNLKLDAPPPGADPQALARLSGLVSGRPILLAASTHPGEEEAVLAAHRALAPRHPRLLTILVPRHPGRGAEVIGLAGDLPSARRATGALPAGDVSVYVADTLGELGLFYRLAPAAFVGGTLTPRGGQSPIEPARLGCAVLHGPHVENFSQAYATLDRAGGARAVADADDLARGFDALLSDPAGAREMARAARDALAGLVGGLERTMTLLEPYLPPVAASATAP